MRFAINAPAHHPFDENSSSRRIVKAAKQVFLSSGGSAFSVRNVAREAGMSLGAVQHFYPTREKLLAAMLEYVVNEYESVYERVLAELPLKGDSRLTGIIDYLVSDLLRPQTREFFFALWALSSHNDSAASLVDAMYTHHRRNLAAFISAARPHFTEERCYEAAAQIAALLEGMMVFTGPGTRHFPSKAAFNRTVKAAVRRLLAD